MAERIEVEVGIIGLGREGASIALALRRYNRDQKAKYQFNIRGYDRQQGTKEALKALEAGDILNARNPQRAARAADLVILAQPLHENETGLREVAGSLRAGAVVLNLSLLQLPAASAAQRLLTEEVHHIGGRPMFNAKKLFDGLAETRYADERLFDGASFYLMPAADTAPEAVDLVSNFAKIIGARPLFIAADEYDALVSATELLPSLLGVASFHSLSASRGWNDIQRLTNSAFALLTHHLLDEHPDALVTGWLTNQASLTRQLDSLLQVLLQLRDLLRSEDRDGLEALLALATERYETWINQRHTGQFDPVDRHAAASISAGSMMRSLFWVGGGKRDEQDGSG